MKQHRISTYKDGFKDVPYCSVCGVEYPDGDCSGKLETVEINKKDERELTEKKT